MAQELVSLAVVVVSVAVVHEVRTTLATVVPSVTARFGSLPVGEDGVRHGKGAGADVVLVESVRPGLHVGRRHVLYAALEPAVTVEGLPPACRRSKMQSCRRT